MYGKVFTLKTTSRVKEMQYPTNRFFDFDERDTEYLQWAGIGKEVEIETELVIPNCVITGINPDGMTLTALPVEREGSNYPQAQIDSFSWTGEWSWPANTPDR